VAQGADTDEPDPGPGPGDDLPFPLVHRLSHSEYRRTIVDLFPTRSLSIPDLPEDPAPYGYDNDGSTLQISRGLYTRYATIAQQVAYEVWMSGDPLVGCDLRNDLTCPDRLIDELGARVYRRPVTADEHALLRGVFDVEPGLSDPVLGSRLLIELLLQSPPFLYRIERAAGPADADGWAPADAWTVANRLSYFLWSTMPDDALRAAAESGSLLTDDGFASQVDRLLADPRAGDGAATFWDQWAELARLNRETRSPEFGFSPNVIVSLREEAARYVQDVYGEDGTLRDLFSGTTVDIDASTARYYGLAPPDPALGWISVDLPSNQRSGLLTLAGFLAAHAHAGNASPVLRGVFVLKRLYCDALGSPPAVGAAMVTPVPVPGSTNRETYEQLTSPPACAACHARINPAGFLFEHYDGTGQWQDLDAGRAIDSSGAAHAKTYADAVGLIRDLPDDASVQRCLVRNLLTYAWGGAHEARAEMEDDVLSVWTADPRLSTVLRAVVTHPRFRRVPLDPGATP
jgi:hypothetical protein